MLIMYTINPDDSATLTLASPSGTPLVRAEFKSPTAQARYTRLTADPIPNAAMRGLIRATAALGRAFANDALPAFESEDTSPVDTSPVEAATVEAESDTSPEPESVVIPDDAEEPDEITV